MAESQRVRSGSTLDDWMYKDILPRESGGGDLTEMSNFLATDDVPQTLFGIPVVSDEEQYTKVVRAFFKGHP